MIQEVMLDASSFPQRPSFLQLTLLSGLLFAFAGYVMVRMEVEPFWIVLAGLSIFVAQLVIRKFPVLLMVSMIYIGTLKSNAAVGFSPTDPTVVTAGLLYVAVVLQILLSAGGLSHYRVKELFAGQIAGIFACCWLFICIAFSLIYSPAQGIGQQKVLSQFVFDLPLVFVPLILLRTNRDVRQTLLLCMAGSLFLAVRAVHRAMHPSEEMLRGLMDPTEIGEGLLMGVATLMVLYYPYREKRWVHRAMIGLVIALAFGIVASVSRSAILSFFIVAIGSLIFLRKKVAPVCRKTILVSIVGIIVIAPVSVMFLLQQRSTYAKVTEKAAEMSAMFGGAPPPGTAGQRYSFSESAWMAFLEKPVLGWGAGGWSTLWHFDDGRVLAYPHDFVLEIAAEQGLVGLVSLGIVLLIIVRKTLRILDDPHHRFTFILPVVGLCLLGNAVTGQVDDRVMWFFCGTLFALNRMLGQNPGFHSLNSDSGFYC